MEKSGMKRYSHLLPKRVGTFPKPKWTGTTSGSFDTRKRNHARGTRQITRLATSIIKQSPFSIHGPTPSLNPTLRSAVSYSPLPLSAHCHANRRILVMTWLRLNDAGSASASTASWRGRRVRKLKGTGLLHQISMVKHSQRHWVPPFLRRQYTNFSLLERSYGICFSLMERSLRSIFAQCFLLPHMLDQVLAHVGDRKADHAV